MNAGRMKDPLFHIKIAGPKVRSPGSMEERAKWGGLLCELNVLLEKRGYNVTLEDGQGYSRYALPHDTSTPDGPDNPRVRHAILAGTASEATRYVKDNLPLVLPRDWWYVTSARTLYGMNNFILHKVGTWRSRKDVVAIMDQLDAMPGRYKEVE